MYTDMESLNDENDSFFSSSIIDNDDEKMKDATNIKGSVSNHDDNINHEDEKETNNDIRKLIK